MFVSRNKNLAPAPRYHPSIGGKFLLSGPPPPPQNRPGFVFGPSPRPASPSKEPLVREPLVKKSLVEKPLVKKRLVKKPLVKNPPVKKPLVNDVKKLAHDASIKKVQRPSIYAGKPLPSFTKRPKALKPFISPETIRPVTRELPVLPKINKSQAQKAGSPWNQYEHDALYYLLVMLRNDEKSGDLSIPPLKDIPLFEKISDQLTVFGIDRSPLSARGYWNRYGRQETGWDERTDSLPGRSLVTSAQESNSQPKARVARPRVFSVRE